jgi:hypothetical protein
MTDYGFYTAEELKTLDDSDLSFEIAGAAILCTPEGDDYLKLLVNELQHRNSK